MFSLAWLPGWLAIQCQSAPEIGVPYWYNTSSRKPALCLSDTCHLVDCTGHRVAANCPTRSLLDLPVEQLRDTVESDFPAILMLNEVEALQTSHMDLGRLQSLVRMSAYCKVVTVDGQVAAFLIALRNGAPYEFARAREIGAITCEYNIDPPNPASRAFHDKFGFRELGTQWVAGGTKHVSLQAAEI